jgi:galactokinase
MNSPLQSLITKARAGFLSAFSSEPECIVQAPGRVNLIGEHTDYNDGFVLPCAINHGTVIACRARSDSQVKVLAIDMRDELDEFSLDESIVANPKLQWANYVRGMVSEIQRLGHTTGGIELAIAGDVPKGAGLSSSASLEVAVGYAIKSLYGLDALSTATLAQAAKRAENNFVGCNCGIMDQLVSAQGKAGHALLIDCRSLVTQQVAIPSDTAVLVVHSRVARGLVDSEYNMRRAQCESAAAYFKVSALRDAELGMLRYASGLDEVTLRRARHVITENQRTLEAGRALATGDLETLGRLMAASHVSMRDDFEITVPPIDHLVDILQNVINQSGRAGGARMTGGGFGGCVVAVLPKTLVATASRAIESQYRAPNGELAAIYECVPSSGAHLLAII